MTDPGQDHHSPAAVLLQILHEVPGHRLVPNHLGLAEIHELPLLKGMVGISSPDELHIRCIDIATDAGRQALLLLFSQRRKTPMSNFFCYLVGNVKPDEGNFVVPRVPEYLTIECPGHTPVIVVCREE